MHGGEAHRVQGLADSLLRFLRQICVGQALRNAAHPIFGFGVGAQCVVVEAVFMARAEGLMLGVC